MENEFHGENCLIKSRCRQERFLNRLLSVIREWSAGFTRFQLLAICLSFGAHAVILFLFHFGENENPKNLSLSYASKVAVSILNEETESFIKPQSEHHQSNNKLLAIDPVEPPMFPQPAKAISIPIKNLPEVYYFQSKELTEKPLVLEDIPQDLGELFPDIPPQKISAWLFINEIGEIDNVRLENSQLPDYAETLLHQSLAKLRFHPGRLNGISVKSKLNIEVLIEPNIKKQTDLNRSLSH